MTTSALDPCVLEQVSTILSTHFTSNVLISRIIELSEPGRRNLLLRLYLDSSDTSLPKTIILKQSRFDASDEQQGIARLARDWAALEFLSTLKNDLTSAPLLYGGSMDHRFVLFEDLGEKHISLVDSLTGNNRYQAIAALHRFMKSIGQLHAESYVKIDTYSAILQRLNPQTISWQEELEKSLAFKTPNLTHILQELAINQTETLWEEIHTVCQDRLAPGPFTTLVHGDICPDNVFDEPSREHLRLIDFEWCFIRNALSDGTYLRMSMPTCWCAKDIPAEVIDACEATYRAELIRTIPAAKDDACYFKAYTSACGYWMIQSLLLAHDVLAKDDIWPSGPVSADSGWREEENFVRPRVLSRLQTFITIADKHQAFPHLQSCAEHALQQLQIRWNEATFLDLYPAFSI